MCKFVKRLTARRAAVGYEVIVPRSLLEIHREAKQKKGRAQRLGRSPTGRYESEAIAVTFEC